MSMIQIIVTAIVQGITEFLPISSSGHLILVPRFTGWPDQGHLVDIAMHIGTLFAIMLYCWRDLWNMTKSLPNFVRGRRDPNARLIWWLIVATIPVVPAGLFLEKHLEEFRSIALVGWTTLGYGLLLYLVDKLCLTVKRVEHMTFMEAAVIGLAQVLAMVPGTSRSGITMTAARAFGYERTEAARFSFLLSIPTIAGAGLIAAIHIFKHGSDELIRDAMMACGIAFVTAIIAVWFLMTWLRRSNFTLFAGYRVILGGLLLTLAYGFGW